MKIKLKIDKNTPIIIISITLIIIAAILLTLAYTAQTRETLAEWKPDAKPGDAALQSPTGSSDANWAAALTRSNEAIILGGAGGTKKEDPKYSYFARGWNAEEQYWQISGTTTQGYERIELSFATRGSNTGPKNFALEYSTDGNEWKPLRDSKNAWITYSVDADNRFHRHGPYELSAAISDLEELSIRFMNTDTVSVIGDTTKSSGTSYITDITITGIAKKES